MLLLLLLVRSLHSSSRASSHPGGCRHCVHLPSCCLLSSKLLLFVILQLGILENEKLTGQHQNHDGKRVAHPHSHQSLHLLVHR
jgi:hypothetical protein